MQHSEACQEVFISNSHVNYELVRKMEVIKKTDSLFMLSGLCMWYVEFSGILVLVVE